MTREELLTRLSSLSLSQFEEVLRRTNTPAEHVRGEQGSQTARAIDTILHIEQRDQLGQLAEVLDELVSSSPVTTANARSGRAGEASTKGVAGKRSGDFSKDRRDFFAAAAGALAAFIACTGRSSGLANWMIHHTTPSPPLPPSPATKLFYDLFGGLEKSYLLPAKNNPRVVIDPRKLQAEPLEIYTTTTLSAARHFAGAVQLDEDRITSVNELIAVPAAHGNLITFGSPTSNLVARIALGFQEIQDGSAGCEFLDSPSMSFKIRYELDAERIRNSGNAHRLIKRVVAGQPHEIPNWGIWTADRGVECPLEHNGLLKEDYLIISCLPNMFNRHSLECGHRILNFGGTHREGTEAASRLAENADVLSELRAGLANLRPGGKAPQYWQALINVNCTNGAARPTKVAQVEEIEVDMAQLRKEADDYSHALQHAALG